MPRLQGGVAALLVPLALFGALACGSRGPGASTAGSGGLGGTRTDDEGTVTLKVTWDGSFEPLAFEIALDTHSLDLDQIDLGALTIARTATGIELKASTWDAPKGGHHREGILLFDSLSARGQAGQAWGSYVELVVRAVGGKAERVLRWDIQSDATP